MTKAQTPMIFSSVRSRLAEAVPTIGELTAPGWEAASAAVAAAGAAAGACATGAGAATCATA